MNLLDSILTGSWWENTDPALIILIILSIIVGSILTVWHKADKNEDDKNFDLRACLLDPRTNRVSGASMFFAGAFVVMTFGFIVLILRDKLTETYAALYGSLFVGGYLGNKAINVWKDNSQVPGSSSSTETTTTTTSASKGSP